MYSLIFTAMLFTLAVSSPKFYGTYQLMKNCRTNSSRIILPYLHSFLHKLPQSEPWNNSCQYTQKSIINRSLPMLCPILS